MTNNAILFQTAQQSKNDNWAMPFGVYVPFINEQLKYNQEQQQKAHYKHQAARVSRFTFNPEDVMNDLHARIIGQEKILTSIENVLFTVKADFPMENKPLAVVLLLGPTGVGKTETVRVITKSILGSADQFCRIDMNTLAQEHYTAALTGSPPGYVGSKEGQTLFDIEKIKGSFSQPGIVLFDEIEKADKQVIRSIMNIFDTGKLTLTSGVKDIDFSNSIIFMTSNLGARELENHIKKQSKSWRKFLPTRHKPQSQILDNALTQHFDPEFINRIDCILPYNWLGSNHLSALVELEITKLNARLQKRNASIQLDDAAKRYLIEKYDNRYGARDISRIFKNNLNPKIAKAILAFPNVRQFLVSIDNEQLVVTFEI